MLDMTALHIPDDVADKAAALEAQGHYVEAAEEYLRASALYHDSREPGAADRCEDAALTVLRAHEVGVDATLT
jgi:hypothetical protein